MGWSFEHKPRGQKMADVFREKIDRDDEQGTWHLLDCASNLNVTYLACEQIDKKTGQREVFGIVCLTRHVKDDYFNFGYKDMTEEMGPCEDDCPERILNLLTPTDSEWALAWRERCRANIVHAKSQPALVPGLVFMTSKPIAFKDGCAYSHFRVETIKGSRILVSAWWPEFKNWSPDCYRLSRQYLKGLDYTADIAPAIVKPAAS